MRGLFGTKPGIEPTPIHSPSWWGLVAPMSLTVIGTVVAGFMASTVGGWLDSPAQSLDANAYGKLALWPGINTAFVISVGVIIVGAFLARSIPTQPWRNPIQFSGENSFQYLYDGLITTSKSITRFTQSGSLLAYNAVIILVVISVLITALYADVGTGFSELVFADSVFQFIVVVLACVFTFGVALTQQRFVAALLLGGIGFSCAILFVMFGAPDLALTQILVETLIIVVFLFVLRQLPRTFEHDNRLTPRSVRIIIATTLGVLMSMFTVMVSGARTAPTTGDQYTTLALPEAGGRNVVNVILVDFRAADTLGEITVLAVAAIGVANLVRMANRRRRKGGAEHNDDNVEEDVAL
jgi:multicomponent Na+:H+ antiporter subunit A